MTYNMQPGSSQTGHTDDEMKREAPIASALIWIFSSSASQPWRSSWSRSSGRISRNFTQICSPMRPCWLHGSQPCRS